jgi:ectoine hydroxylase-related dioxygenase (phytanoyl-CoA dioxygenase family)
MTFASGSNKLGDLRGKPISDESEREFARLIDERSLATETYGAMAAGDATFHAGWTLHSAGRNPTQMMRSVMTVIYMADGARVARVIEPGQELDHKVWLGSKPAGELIDSQINPRLWPRT